MLLLERYVEGTVFIVYTNHTAVRSIRTFLVTNDLLAHCGPRLSEFWIVVIHRSGIKNRTVDKFSGIQTSVVDGIHIHDDLPFAGVNFSEDVMEGKEPLTFTEFHVYNLG